MSRLALLVVLASVAVNVANASIARKVVARVTPIEKVVSLMEELREKVSTEGDREAKTYDTFACFCKDTAEEKTTAVDNGQNLKVKLEADLAQLASDREGKDADIADILERISSTEAEISVMRKERREEQLRYEGNEVDLSAGIEGLQGAIRMLKATKKEVGLLELAPVAKTLKRALLVAESLGTFHQSSPQLIRVISALNQQTELPASDTYSFHADDIVDTLESLLKDFQARKHSLDEEETNAKESNDKLVTDKSNAIEDDKTAFEAAKHEKAEFASRIATASEDLTITSAQLMDDQKYLAELTSKCSSKAKVWDQRTSLRAAELAALTQAITILKSPAVATASEGEDDDEDEEEGGEVLLQNALPAKSRIAGLRSPGANFLQLAASQSAPSHPLLSVISNQEGTFSLSKRNEVVSLLRASAQDLKSSVLASLATQLTKDPFAKIKGMIQNLIERLLKQAQSEASHKGWCDKEMGLAEQTRDQRAKQLSEVNTRMQSGEARRDKLDHLVSELHNELDALKSQLEDSRDMRAEEKLENAEAIKQAEEGRDAVARAIDTLTKFYKTAAKASFIATGAAPAAAATPAATSASVDDDAPDAGFDGAYSGAQGGKEGVIGMLEVVQGDFDREVTQTKEAEKKSAQDFLEFETTQSSSIAEKEEASKSRQRSLDECLKGLADDKATMKDAQSVLDKSLNELLALHPTCVGEPTTAAERQMQREQEIGSLRQALCTLESQSNANTEC